MSTHGELTRNESYTSEQPFIGSARSKVMAFVSVRGKFGATREEIAAGTGLKVSSVCGRVKELLVDGELVESGMSRIGDSGKGNSVVVAKEVEHAGSKGPTPPPSEAIRTFSPVGVGHEIHGQQPRCGDEALGELRHDHQHPQRANVATPKTKPTITQQLAALKTPTTKQLDLF